MVRVGWEQVPVATQHLSSSKEVIPVNVMERTRARIKKATPTGEDKLVLKYIYNQLAPSNLLKREENGDGDVKHLIEVANHRLKPYEKGASQ